MKQSLWFFFLAPFLSAVLWLAFAPLPLGVSTPAQAEAPRPEDDKPRHRRKPKKPSKVLAKTAVFSWPKPPSGGFVPLFQQRGRIEIRGWTPDSRYFLFVAHPEVDCRPFAEGRTLSSQSYQLRVAVRLDTEMHRVETYFLDSLVPSEPTKEEYKEVEKGEAEINPCHEWVRTLDRQLRKHFLPRKAYLAWKKGQTFLRPSSSKNPTSNSVFSPVAGSNFGITFKKGSFRYKHTRRKGRVPVGKRTFKPNEHWQVSLKKTEDSSEKPEEERPAIKRPRHLLFLNLLADGKPIAKATLPWQIEIEDGEEREESFGEPPTLFHVWSPDGKKSVGIFAEIIAQGTPDSRAKDKNLIFFFSFPSKHGLKTRFPAPSNLPWNGPWLKKTP